MVGVHFTHAESVLVGWGGQLQSVCLSVIEMITLDLLTSCNLSRIHVIKEVSQSGNTSDLYSEGTWFRSYS
jgi:hypothetical protein